jgi:futalosine hydrolase
MNILFVAATEPEVASVIAHTKAKKNSENDFSAEYKTHKISFLITGVGMVATAYHLAKKVSSEKFDVVINAGIAGTFDKEKFSLGTVVNVVSERFPELGAEDDKGFLSVFDLGLIKQDEFPFESGNLLNKNIFLNNEIINSLPKAHSVTVNKVHGNDQSIKDIMSQYKPDIESMEGAAFFYCCLHEKINFIQLRGISNVVEKRNKNNWNIPLAIDNLTKTIIQYLDSV